MEFSCYRSKIHIECIDERDDAYIEDTLNLKKDGDWCKLVRHSRPASTEFPGRPCETVFIYLETEARRNR